MSAALLPPDHRRWNWNWAGPGGIGLDAAGRHSGAGQAAPAARKTGWQLHIRHGRPVRRVTSRWHRGRTATATALTTGGGGGEGYRGGLQNQEEATGGHSRAGWHWWRARKMAEG